MHGRRARFLQFAVAPILFMFAIGLLTMAVGCGSDKDDEPLFNPPPPGDLPNADEYVFDLLIEGTDAPYVAEEFPTGTGNTAPTVLGASQYVEGASFAVLITPSDTATQLLIGVRSTDEGYWTYDLGASPKREENVWFGGDANADSPNSKLGMAKLTKFDAAKAPGDSYLMLVTPVEGVEGFALYISQSDGETISRPLRHNAILNTVASGSDALQVSLNFVHDVDMDLHLSTPEGEDIFYANRTSVSGGELDLDSNAACNFDSIRNENISWATGTPTSGSYSVRVNLWSACNEPGPFPYLVTTVVDGQTQTHLGEFALQDEYAGGAFDGTLIATIDIP